MHRDPVVIMMTDITTSELSTVDGGMQDCWGIEFVFGGNNICIGVSR